MNKETVRKTERARRAALTLEEVAMYSAQIKEQVLQAFDFSQLQFVHVFLPIASNKEVNTLLLVRELKLKYPHLTLVAPITDFGGGAMRHGIVGEEKDLIVNSYGIPEPAGADFTEVSKLEIIFVPLLACDVVGNRLGYGKGYYDQFLVKCAKNTIFCGLNFFKPYDLINSEPWDIRINRLIIPNAQFQF